MVHGQANPDKDEIYVNPIMLLPGKKYNPQSYACKVKKIKKLFFYQIRIHTWMMSPLMKKHPDLPNISEEMVEIIHMEGYELGYDSDKMMEIREEWPRTWTGFG